MKNKCYFIHSFKILSKKYTTLFFKIFLTVPLIFGLTITVYSQKKGGKGNGKGTKDIIVRSCTQYIGNGLYRVNFGYDNPNKKEISINENDSYVVSNKGKNKDKGLNKFKSGSVNKAFTREFGKNEYVEWTVISPSGKVHTVVANANSSHCPPEEEGIIFPVFGQGNGKTDKIIGSKLYSLVEGNAGDNPSEIIYQIDENKENILIVIVPHEGQMQQTIDIIQNTYSVPTSAFLIEPNLIISNNLTTIDVSFPISLLGNLNLETAQINFVRPLYRAKLNKGIVTTQGDSVQGSDIVRNSFFMVNGGETISVDGRGIKVGVISDSYDTQPFTGQSKATIGVQNKDLPGDGNPSYPISVEILQEYSFGIASDEGRAMLEIIHDIAPASHLGFYSGILSSRDFELGVNAFKDADYDIITDDITFITEPFFQEGRVSEAINSFTRLPGKTYISSAGNFSNNGSQGIFRSSTAPINTNFLPDSNTIVAHVFGTNPDGSEDILQKIHVEPGINMIVLQSNESLSTQDNSNGAVNDLDIYIVDDNSNLLVGNNRVNIDGDPTEIIVFESKGTGEANIMITSATGAPTTNLAFRYIIFRNEGLDLLEYGGASTVSGHAMTPAAVTVGAVNFKNGTNPIPEPFSSYAGNLSNGKTTLIDFAAADGVYTNVPSVGQLLNNDDIFTSFYGTSAAAPHAAASIALIMSALPSWYPDGLTIEYTPLTNQSSDQAIQLLKLNATPAGNVDQTGSGFLNVEKAFQQIAAQAGFISSFTSDPDKILSAELTEVTLTGKKFPENPIVTFGGEKLEIISSSESKIIVLVPAFTGNSPVIVVTPAITPTGNDLAVSNEIFFLEEGKIAIDITANNISAEFGQTVQMTYNVEGLPDGETIASQGLPEIKYNSTAVFPYPDVNNYTITPYFEIDLTEDQLNEFQINFKPGILSIMNRDLLVQPQDATFIYGEPIVINSNFIYNIDGVENNNAFLSTLKNDYKSTFYPDNTLILINKFRPVVNDYDYLNLLNQGAWMASDRVIQNKFRAVVNGMNFIDLDMEHLIDYKITTDDSTTNKFRAVVNKFRAVVNGIDLLSNNVELSIENKFRAVVNSSGLGGENDLNNYDNLFTLVDAEDASNDIQENAISDLYSTFLITGKDATLNQESKHIIYPGALLAPIFANFNKSFSTGKLTILPKEISVEIDDILINQGESIDLNAIVTTFNNEFAYNETIETVFPDGIPYYFINENGEEFEVGDSGIYFIKIREPQIENIIPQSNYSLTNTNSGQLFVNPYGNHLKKIRIYLDCVEENPETSNGLNFIAHYRYENPNSKTIYVLHGKDNYISGTALFDDTNLTYIFLPGQGTCDIPFNASNGNKITWNLTTFESTHKTSVSSDATADSGKCNAKQIGNTSYSVFPNPVENTLIIQKNISESSTVDIFDMYGVLHFHDIFYNNRSNLMEVDTSSFSNGIYYVRITTNKSVYVFNVMKE